MHKELLRLTEIVSTDIPIKSVVDEVYELRMALDEVLSDQEKQQISNAIKAKVQLEARLAWEENNSWGAILAATGVGKSKVAIDVIHKAYMDSPNNEGAILIVVPTERLRDNNWQEEFAKWGKTHLWDEVERCCYASLNKYTGRHFRYVVLDEGHNITDNNVVPFFQNNEVNQCMLLTATRPKDAEKVKILTDLKILPVYQISLDEAVKLGIVSPYDITIITMRLDSVDKYIEAGTKNKRFYNTEKAQYAYLSSLAFAAPGKMTFIRRMQFIYSLRSKTRAAQQVLEQIIPKELKTLIFCGGKKQAIEVCDKRFFSKPTLKRPKEDITTLTSAKQQKFIKDFDEYQYILANWQGNTSLEQFIAGEINRLACVNAMNEGQNIPELDVGLVIQLNRNERNLIQRIGRHVRFRPGHIAKILILCVEDTIEKDWVKEATSSLGASNIKTIELSRLLAGIETISF